jgi:ankyrin repeat protein
VETLDVILQFLDNTEVARVALWNAAEKGRSKIVGRLLEVPGLNINEKVQGQTILYRACKSRDVDTVRMLIDAGTDASVLSQAVGSREETPLHSVCATLLGQGWMDEPEKIHKIVSMLIKAGVDVNKQTELGYTALHQSARPNFPELPGLLIAAGAQVHVQDKRGNSALHVASSPGAVIALVEQGKADVYARNLQGEIPLLSMIQGSASLETITSMAKYTSLTEVTDPDGNSPLHFAVRSGRRSAELVTMLLDAGANPSARNRSGHSPIRFLSRWDDSGRSHAIMDILIKAGADINARDHPGSTVLFDAVAPNSRVSTHASKDTERATQVLEELLARGAAPDIRNKAGRTLLMQAVSAHVRDQRSVAFKDTQIPYLLGLGLDPLAVDDSGHTLLHEHMGSFRATGFGKGFWKELLELGLDPNQADHRGWLPLHLAVAKMAHFARGMGMTDGPFGEILTDTNNVNSPDFDGIAPLHIAVVTSEQWVKILLEKGADPTLATRGGLTPLHLAVRARQSNNVGMLLAFLSSSGDSTSLTAAVNAQDRDQRTPLYYACRSGIPETVELLLDAGADLHSSQVLDACADFENDNARWARQYERFDLSVESLDSVQSRLVAAVTAAVRLKNYIPLDSDESRSPEFARQVMTDGDPLPDLEEVLNVLYVHGLDLCVLSSDRGKRSVPTLLNRNHEYTARCFLNFRKKHGISLDEPAASEKYLAHTMERLDQAEVQALRDCNALRPGEINIELCRRFTGQRKSHLIEEMFHLGTDFLQYRLYSRSPSFCEWVCNLDILIVLGMAYLVRQIGKFEAERRFREGTAHAYGDPTKPGLCLTEAGIESLDKNKDKDAHARNSLITAAVRRNRPNMRVLKVLVEELHVDINETGKGARKQSALHFCAQGEHWWCVAQAIPYLV